jgi:hypothetical protein
MGDRSLEFVGEQPDGLLHESVLIRRVERSPEICTHEKAQPEKIGLIIEKYGRDGVIRTLDP